MQKKSKSFIGNILYAFGSQAISLFMSILTSLFLPKILGLSEYSYFQLFLFYSSYSGFALFGLNDGIYLKEGGKQWDTLDKESLGNQWKLSFIIQLFIGFFIILFLLLDDKIGYDRMFVCISFCIFMLFSNTWGYFSYIFQAVNQTKVYSKSIMVDRLSFLLFFFIAFLLKCKSYKIYVILYVISKFLSMIYCVNLGKELIKFGIFDMRKSFHDMISNMKIGINLMIANIASMLILGFGRFIVDTHWGIQAFGKFSFSLSLTNFFLQFISQVSMVLFPALRRIDESKQNKIYFFINNILFILLPLSYISYLPLSQILIKWLPEYSESLKYLILMLPICIYDGKMNLLYSTYFKVLRLERKLLFVNIISLIFSIAVTLITTYIFNELLLVILGMVISIIFRSILSSIIITRNINASQKADNLIELSFSAIFMLLTWNYNNIKSMVFMVILYILIIYLRRKKLKSTITFFKEGISL